LFADTIYYPFFQVIHFENTNTENILQKLEVPIFFFYFTYRLLLLCLETVLIILDIINIFDI